MCSLIKGTETFEFFIIFSPNRQLSKYLSDGHLYMFHSVQSCCFSLVTVYFVLLRQCHTCQLQSHLTCKYFIFCAHHGVEQILTKPKKNTKLYVLSSLIISPSLPIQDKTTHQYKQDCESHTLLRCLQYDCGL